MNVSPVGNVLIEVAAPSNDAAPQGARPAYIDDVASRRSGRPATDEEVAAVKRGAE